MTPATAFPAPSRVNKHHGQPTSHPSILPVQRLSCHRGSGAYLAPGCGCGIVCMPDGRRSDVAESAGPASGGGSGADLGAGRSRRARTGLWSDVVYEGMDVYRSTSIDDCVVDWSEADV